jgi:hypothetical protein
MKSIHLYLMASWSKYRACWFTTSFLKSGETSARVPKSSAIVSVAFSLVAKSPSCLRHPTEPRPSIDWEWGVERKARHELEVEQKDDYE